MSRRRLPILDKADEHRSSLGEQVASTPRHGPGSIPRVAVSRCLLGDAVRYDGGHKRNRLITDCLSRGIEWIPLCPEVEAGLSVPREPMHLAGLPQAPAMVAIQSGRDLTQAVTTFARDRMRRLVREGVDGFILKKGSPSCGLRGVPIYQPEGPPRRSGTGLFAAACLNAFPLVPAEDEGRLNDTELLERFLIRVFAHARWRQLQAGSVTRGALVRFHMRYKFLLLAHGPHHYRRLGRLVAESKAMPLHTVIRIYGQMVMDALARRTTINRHLNVLQHAMGYLVPRLTAAERHALHERLEDYRSGLIPLSVPRALIHHYARSLPIPYLLAQYYFEPYPRQLQSAY